MVSRVDEKLKCLLSTSGQRREMWFLTEDGLYEVLMQSRKPIAKAFKKEVKQNIKSHRLKRCGRKPHVDEFRLCQTIYNTS